MSEPEDRRGTGPSSRPSPATTTNDDPGSLGVSYWRPRTEAGQQPPRERPDPRDPLDGGKLFGGSSWYDPSPSDLDEDAPSDDERPKRKRTPVVHPYPRKTLAALGGTVRVVRDNAGVPHIFAKHERDAYAGLGACMAEDRLWQMDLLRRLATGRVAEILGSPFVGSDALIRTLGLPRRAMAAAGALEGAAREVLAAFVAGVNMIRAEGRLPECELLAYELEPWTIADSLAIEFFFAWVLSLESWPAKLLVARALAGAGLERARWIAPTALETALVAEERLSAYRRIDLRLLDTLFAVPGGGPAGSNNWAIAGTRSASGGALVASDPHMASTLPSLMYLAHLEAPGLAIAGAVNVGGPTVLIGRNRHCAWGVTNFTLDDADCVIEELDGIGNFRTETGWSKLGRRSEVIRVRNETSVKLEVCETRNGPLVSSLVEQLRGPAPARTPAIALRWGVNGHGSALAGWLLLGRAGSLDEIGAAAAMIDRGPLALNLVAADSSGAVGHWGVGGAPLRDPVARLPVFGHRGEAKWTGVAPLSKIAVRRDPPAGVVLSANEAHVAPAAVSYPVHAYADHPYRAERIRGVLGEKAPLGVAECRALQRDVKDLAAYELLSHFRRAVAGRESEPDPVLRAACTELTAWDGTASEDSAGAALFYVAMFKFALAELFPEPQYGPLARHWRFAWWGASRILGADSSPWFADERAKDAFLVRVLGRAAAWLGEHRGPDPATWSWGALHPYAPRHPLAFHESFAAGAPPAWESPGSPFTVLQHRFVEPSPPFAVTVSPAVRMIADLSTDEIQLALPTGESGQAASPHLTDQMAAWRNGQYLTLRLTPEIVGETTELVSG